MEDKEFLVMSQAKAQYVEAIREVEGESSGDRVRFRDHPDGKASIINSFKQADGSWVQQETMMTYSADSLLKAAEMRRLSSNTHGIGA